MLEPWLEHMRTLYVLISEDTSETPPVLRESHMSLNVTEC